MEQNGGGWRFLFFNRYNTVSEHCYPGTESASLTESPGNQRGKKKGKEKKTHHTHTHHQGPLKTTTFGDQLDGKLQ